MSVIEHHRRSRCRLCNGDGLESVLSLTPTPPANAFVSAEQVKTPQACFPLDIYFCHDCGHSQLLDVVDPGAMFGHYVYVSGTSPKFVAHFVEYAQDVIERLKLKPGDLVVDIGSNDGTFLKCFQDAGMRVLGIDPAEEIAAQANEDGIETLHGFFTPKMALEIREKYGPASAISANNVFAHIDDLESIVEGVRDLLAPEGGFIFEVSYLLDVYENTLFDTIYHEHLDYHRVGPLRRFFEKNGMAFIDAQRVETHGGSLRGYVGHGSQGVPPAAILDELEALEQKAGLDKPVALQGFSRKIDLCGEELKDLLASLKKDGKSIAGYGAPAKATTLMYHFGLDANTISFIVDDSPLKQGLYSPGLHVPILPSRALYERKPDYVVILAWNFAEAIIENNRDFLKAGGHFIVPLPTPIIH